MALPALILLSKPHIFSLSSATFHISTGDVNYPGELFTVPLLMLEKSRTF